MKRIFAFVVATSMVMGFAALASAQDGGPQGGKLEGKQKGQRHGQMRVMMQMQKQALEDLKLTEVQHKAIRDLNKKMADELKAIAQRAKDGGPGDQGKPRLDRDAMKRIREEHQQGLREILGTEKFREYREIMMKKMKEYREKHGEKRGEGRRKGGADKSSQGDKGKSEDGKGS